MIAFFIVLAVLLLLLLTKVGVSLSRDNNSFDCTLKVGLISFHLLPRNKLTKNNESSSRKKSNRRKLTFNDYLELIQIGLQSLGRLRKSLYVDVFHIRLTAGLDDPYSTAITCAYAQTIKGILSPLAQAAFRVGESQVEIIPDFESLNFDVSGNLMFSARVGRLAYIALRLSIEYLRFQKQRKKISRTNEETIKDVSTASENSASQSVG